MLPVAQPAIFKWGERNYFLSCKGPDYKIELFTYGFAALREIF